MKHIQSGGSRLPDRNKTKSLYEQQLSANQALLQQFVQEVRLLLEQQGLSPTIKFRVKSFNAYFDKLRKQTSEAANRRVALLSDFFGLRIVCPFLEDIETVSDLISTHFEVVDTERKANQHSFREFGYDSLHLSIRLDKQQLGRVLPGVRKVCEIQLRTILQDAWAEVEHELVYKSDISLPNQSIRRKLASLNATLTLSDLIFQEIRDYQKEIRQQRRKRRDSVEQASLAAKQITIFHPTKGTTPTRRDGMPMTASSLEKTMLRALAAHSAQELENAITLYGQLLGMQLDRTLRSLVYNHRGMAYFATGNHHRALKDFSSAINYDPENDRSFANRGLCYRVMKKFDRALHDFTRAIKINPSRAEGYFGRAQTYYDLQRYDLARADCDKALGIHSGYQPALELIQTLPGNDL